MDDTTGPVPRVIVGISRSRASWWALAWAVGEARRRGARLLVLHAFRPRIVYPLPDPRYAGVRDDPYAERMATGHRLIWTAISEALGQMPGDISFEEDIVPGRAAVELARLAHGGDVLVLGVRHRGWLRRLAPGSVARACSRRAECPVVIVPEPSPRALAAALPADARSRWRWWPPHRETQVTS